MGTCNTDVIMEHNSDDSGLEGTLPSCCTQLTVFSLHSDISSSKELSLITLYKMENFSFSMVFPFLLLAVLGLHCFAFSSCSKLGLLSVAVVGLL